MQPTSRGEGTAAPFHLQHLQIAVHPPETISLRLRRRNSRPVRLPGCQAVFIAARRNGSDTRRLSPDTSVCTAASSPASPPWCHFCPTQPGHALLDAPSHTMSENYGSHGQHTRLMYASDPSAFQTVSRMAFTAPSGMQRGKLPATLTREYSYAMHCTHAQQVQTSHRH